MWTPRWTALRLVLVLSVALGLSAATAQDYYDEVADESGEGDTCDSGDAPGDDGGIDGGEDGDGGDFAIRVPPREGIL